MNCKDLNGIETSIGVCRSKNNRFLMITRWELGNNPYIHGCRHLYIDYSGTEEQFNEGKSKVNLTNEMKDMLCTLPQSIGMLTDLRVLSVYGDDPKKICLKTLPDFIGNLTNLRELELTHNKLTTLPNSICNLRNLEVLDLSFNDFRSLPDPIGNLKNLEELILSGNYNFSQLPDSVGNLENLKTLNLCETSLRSLPKSMSNLTNLENLYLSKSELKWYRSCRENIRETHDYSYDWFKEIVNQSLAHALCTSPDSLSLEQCSSLDLSGKNLKQIPFGVCMMEKKISQLKNERRYLDNINMLTKLDISNNQLTKIPCLLQNLFSLKKLYIHNNPNLNHLPDFLWKMRKLKELKIDGKLVKDLPENAQISLNDKDLDDAVLDLTLTSKNNGKLSDKQLSNITGPYTVYLKKN